MSRDTDPIEFQGHWEQRGAIKVPVHPSTDYSDLFDFGHPLTSERTVTDLDHVPSHAGFNTHKRRGEEPCEECKAAERLYHHNRRQR